MISKTVLDTFSGFVGEENIHLAEPLAPRTSFRLGGACDCLVEPGSEEELRKIINYLHLVELPYFVLGNGTNTLVKDAGYGGIVLLIGPRMSRVEVSGNLVRAQAGALLSEVAVEAQRSGLSGLEFAAGIPGSVGGGVVMNAGAFGGEMSQVVRSVHALTGSGEAMDLDRQSLQFGYRYSVMRNHPLLVTDVTLELSAGDPAQIQATMEEYGKKRREKQPLEFPSAGSVFKRPEGYYAGQLIMDAGMRGFQIGGARVSDKHCGFIINTGKGTTAEDVLDVMAEVQERVKLRFGVRLEPEIVVLGTGRSFD